MKLSVSKVKLKFWNNIWYLTCLEHIYLRCNSITRLQSRIANPLQNIPDPKTRPGRETGCASTAITWTSLSAKNAIAAKPKPENKMKNSKMHTLSTFTTNTKPTFITLKTICIHKSSVSLSTMCLRSNHKMEEKKFPMKWLKIPSVSKKTTSILLKWFKLVFPLL